MTNAHVTPRRLFNRLILPATLAAFALLSPRSAAANETPPRLLPLNLSAQTHADVRLAAARMPVRSLEDRELNSQNLKLSFARREIRLGEFPFVVRNRSAGLGFDTSEKETAYKFTIGGFKAPNGHKYAGFTFRKEF